MATLLGRFQGGIGNGKESNAVRSECQMLTNPKGEMTDSAVVSFKMLITSSPAKSTALARRVKLKPFT
jgi:hypothetical protein